MQIDGMNTGDMSGPRMVFTYSDYERLPARMFDALDFIRTTREELREANGNN